MSTTPRGPHTLLALRVACAPTSLGHGIAVTDWLGSFGPPACHQTSVSLFMLFLPLSRCPSSSLSPRSHSHTAPSLWLHFIPPSLGSIPVCVSDPIPKFVSDALPLLASVPIPLSPASPCIPLSPLLPLGCEQTHPYFSPVQSPFLNKKRQQAGSPLSSHPPPLPWGCLADMDEQ